MMVIVDVIVGVIMIIRVGVGMTVIPCPMPHALLHPVRDDNRMAMDRLHMHRKTIDCFNRLRRDHIMTPSTVDGPVLQEDEPVREPYRKVQVVHRHDRRHLMTLHHRLYGGEDLNLVFQIKTACGLIEEQEPGFLHEGTGNTSPSGVPRRSSHRCSAE